MTDEYYQINIMTPEYRGDSKPVVRIAFDTVEKEGVYQMINRVMQDIKIDELYNSWIEIRLIKP